MARGTRIFAIVGGLIVAVVLIAGGVYLWQNLVFRGVEQALEGTPHTFLVQAGVPDEDIALVTEGVQLADAYFRDTFGATVENPIQIRLASSTPCIPFEPLATGRTAHVEDNVMCVNTVGYVWDGPVATDRTLGLYIIAHEYFHSLQEQTGCLPDPEDHDYAWWIEGSATYAGWQALIDAGLVSEADVMARLREWGGFSDDVDALPAYENRISGDAAYALGYRAVDDMAMFSSEADALYAFCEQMDDPDQWATTFEAVIDLPLEDFYAQFADGRANQ